MKKLFFTAIPLSFIASLVFAHGGGLDSNGGHHNRKSGGYHCHRCPCFDYCETKLKPTKKKTYSSKSSKAVKSEGTYIVLGSKGVNLRIGPGTGYPALETIPYKARVISVYLSGDWRYVKYGKCESGWIYDPLLTKSIK